VWLFALRRFLSHVNHSNNELIDMSMGEQEYFLDMLEFLWRKALVVVCPYAALKHETPHNRPIAIQNARLYSSTRSHPLEGSISPSKLAEAKGSDPRAR
jgi:hypothetical protein